MMPELWFIIVTFMITMYVVLDGFDLGAGAIHLIAAKTEEERESVLKAIGPVWDGNEVWLIAGGGTLYFAFPMLYASSFSGFYLPLMIVLWLLMLRGAGIELRHQVHHPMWRSFWDVTFALSSILLTVFFGAALGNVVRGVPLRGDGYFFEPLWTTFTVVPESGILDWFTTLMGLVACFALTIHGANYIAMKTGGDLRLRAHRIAGRVWWALIVASALALIATFTIDPDMWLNYTAHPWGFLFPLGGIAALAGMRRYNRREQDARAFFSSAMFIGSMLPATAFGLYPNLLRSSIDTKDSITVSNAAAHEYGLSVGLIWWTLGIILAGIYSVFMYRSVRGKVTGSGW